MTAKKIGIVVLVFASMLAAFSFANENRKVARRINVPSHLKQVGLSFRHERNDIAGFTLTGQVLVDDKAGR